MKGVYLQYHCPWRNSRDSRQKLIIATNSRAGMRPEAQAIVRARRSLFDPTHHGKSKKHTVDGSTESYNPTACSRHVSATVAKFVPRLGTKGSSLLYLSPWNDRKYQQCMVFVSVGSSFTFPIRLRSWWALILMLSINHTYQVTNHLKISLGFSAIASTGSVDAICAILLHFSWTSYRCTVLAHTVVRCLQPLMTFSDPNLMVCLVFCKTICCETKQGFSKASIWSREQRFPNISFH